MCGLVMVQKRKTAICETNYIGRQGGNTLCLSVSFSKEVIFHT